MTGPDHYLEAERLLKEAESRSEADSRALWYLELAKLHTALAEVAATALNSDGREWIEVAGRRFSSLKPVLHEAWGARLRPVSVSEEGLEHGNRLLR
jgi:hypothetical protein